MAQDASPGASPYVPLLRLRGHSRSVTAIAFSGDGEHLATGGADNLVNIWHCPSGTLRQACDGHTQGVNDVCWARDAIHVVSASDDKTVRMWDARSVRDC